MKKDPATLMKLYLSLATFLMADEEVLTLTAISVGV